MVDSLLECYWSELKGKIRERWEKLTDDDVDQIAGKAAELIARVQGRYAISSSQAEAEVHDWISRKTRAAG